MLFPIESGHACAAPNSGPFPILVRTPDRTRRKYKPRCDLDVKKFNSEPGSCKRPASLSCVFLCNNGTMAQLLKLLKTDPVAVYIDAGLCAHSNLCAKPSTAAIGR